MTPNKCRYCKTTPDVYSKELTGDMKIIFYVCECPRCHAKTHSNVSEEVTINKWNQTFGYGGDKEDR